MSLLDELSPPESLPRGKVTWRSGAGVAWITLTNPPANAYSHEMMLDLDAAVLRARFDDEVHVLVLSGAGEKFFCAGADIAMLDGVTPSFKYSFCLHANETMLRLEHTPKLVIAALEGHCVGGGLEVALACDLRMARKGSGRCGLPEVTLGVLPGTGGTQRLARLVGKSRAIELMAEGRLFDYDEAATLGIVNRVVERETSEAFLVEALTWARSFCPPARAALSVGLIKRAVQTGAEVPLEAGLALERELQARLFASEDASAGIGAYVAKSKPTFQGR